MSTLPGGRLAPPPPVTRVAAGGAAFLLASVFAFVWAATSTLEQMTSNRNAIPILARALQEPYRAAMVQALRTQQGSPVAVESDLVSFSVDRAAAADVNVSEVLARRRAAELYEGGFPQDPGGRNRTSTIFPRSLLTVFTEARHQNLGTAKMAGLIGMGTGFLLCAVIATGAARFLLPGAAALVGYGLLEYHIRFAYFWFEPNALGGQVFRGRIRVASVTPTRDLLFVTITLLVAGAVFRSLRGPMRAVMKSAAKGEAAEPAGAASGPAAGEASK